MGRRVEIVKHTCPNTSVHTMSIGFQLSNLDYTWFPSLFLHLRDRPRNCITFRLCTQCFYRYEKRRFLKQDVNGQVSKLLIQHLCDFITTGDRNLSFAGRHISKKKEPARDISHFLDLILEYAVSVSYCCQSPEELPERIRYGDTIWFGENLSCCGRRPFYGSGLPEIPYGENEDFLASNPDRTYRFYATPEREFIYDLQKSTYEVSQMDCAQCGKRFRFPTCGGEHSQKLIIQVSFARVVAERNGVFLQEVGDFNRRFIILNQHKYTWASSMRLDNMCIMFEEPGEVG